MIKNFTCNDQRGLGKSHFWLMVSSLGLVDCCWSLGFIISMVDYCWLLGFIVSVVNYYWSLGFFGHCLVTTLPSSTMARAKVQVDHNSTKKLTKYTATTKGKADQVCKGKAKADN